METGNLFSAFKISSSGLSAQRARLNAISSNIANAHTTRTPEGGPYLRQVVTTEVSPGLSSNLFEKLLAAKNAQQVEPAKTSGRHLGDAELLSFDQADGRVRFTAGTDRTTPTRMEFDPGHPDANEEGYVEYPNVEVVTEMVDLMAAARAYEANVTVLNSTKSMLRKALEI
ncbi:MAG: flagellar basal body rod protein FlgC [Gemmatimonadetes bacterium]|nr:flagellar basal body rod protein FlgC [Gemmatimonadota bacterium]